ncbi:MAG TPA: two-component regulator propeller domain-containing protein [Flavobacteriaceae bacterium]|nr:two-component regulator propeller domain-containing protein [Flavobacteriaceae bacterium]
MKMLKPAGFFALFLLIGKMCFSQNNHFPDTLKVKQIAQKQGLSQLNVLSIDFDDNGYLWVGTEDGLNRFNGYEMALFPKKNQLKDDHIRGLVITGDTLWLATNTQSIVAYVLSQDRFFPLFKKKSLFKNKALKFGHGIFELNDRYLLATSLKNCMLIDRKTLDFTIFPLPDQKRDDYLLGVHPLRENTFLLGTFFSGILRLNTEEKTLIKAKTFPSFENNPVYAFHSLGKNSLLIGTEKGLFHFDEKSEETTALYRPETKNPIRCFYDWNANQILIGCFNGLMVFDKNTRKLKPVAISDFYGKIYSSMEVSEIQEDGQGGVWFATQGKGLFFFHRKRQKFEPQRIKLPRNPDKNFISIFNFLRENNTLWMATELGFVKHNLNTGEYKLYRTDRLCYTLAKDGNNTVWGGGFNQGLQKYNRKTDRFENVVFSKGAIPDRDIVQITPFGNDSLWVATWSAGMYVFDLNDYSVKPLKINGKSLSRARISFVDSKDRVWIGSDDGLYRVKNGKTKHYAHDPENENSLSNNRIFGIAENSDGNIWVGTAKGLNRIDLKTGCVQRYTQQPGLPNDFIYGVLPDGNENIWVSTNFGISELNTATGKFKNYTVKDGLQNNEFNGKAAYKDPLGNLYFGGMNGFNVFHPNKILVNKNVGKTIVEQVKLFDEPIEKNMVYTDTLRFRHNENVLTFNFAALNFLLPEKNRYRFKMEGFDKAWRPVTSERSTTYTNLNPGTYTFWVQGSNNELLWGKPDSVAIIIRAPWYETTLFKIGLVFFVLLLLAGWFLYRNYQQNQKNRLLRQMVRVRTKELRASNNDLNQAAKQAKEQKENIAFLMRELNHRVKNNLQLMASLLDMQKGNTAHKTTQNNLQAAQNRLFTIAKIHDLLGGSKQQDFTELDVFIRKLTKELVIFMEVPIKLEFDLEAVKVSQKKINPIGIILNELITNSIKHGFTASQKEKTIHILLEKEGEFGKLVYRDNGKGISENITENQKSLGLKLIRNLALQLGGRVEISSENEAVFKIYFAC